MVAIASDLSDLNGFESHALYYLVSLAQKLGATQFVQTFSAVTLTSTGPALVTDTLPLYERVMVEPRVCGCHPFKPAVDGVPLSVLATYHGPEFPSKAEVNSIAFMKATHIALGTSHGLMIANAFGLQPVGIADGAFTLVNETIEDILHKSRAASEAIGQIIVKAVGKLANAEIVQPEFTASNQKALKMEDLDPVPLNVQERQETVARVAAIIPNVSVAFTFEHLRHYECLTEVLEAEKLPIENEAVFITKLNGKDIVLATGTRMVCRALAEKGIHNIAIGVGIPTKENVPPVLSIVDHINISGISPLVGKNQVGKRFPDQSFLYKPLDAFPKAISYSVPDIRQVGQAYREFANQLRASVVVQFGAIEATVALHQKEKQFSHIVCTQPCPSKPFCVSYELIESLVI
jgi:hypothetical protein